MTHSLPPTKTPFFQPKRKSFFNIMSYSGIESDVIEFIDQKIVRRIKSYFIVIEVFLYGLIDILAESRFQVSLV